MPASALPPGKSHYLGLRFAENAKARSRDRALVCKHRGQLAKSAHSKKAFPFGKAFQISGGADDRYKQVQHTPTKPITSFKIISLH